MKAKRLKKNKMFLPIILLFIIVGLISGGTIAWLTKQTSVSNIFTVGTFENPTTSPTNPEEAIEIEGNIYEPSWNSEETHKLLPGNEYEKDPYVGIGKGSEDAVVYIYVENSFSNKVYFNINEGWEPVEGKTKEGFKEGTYTSGLFKYSSNLIGNIDKDVWTEQPLFSSIITDDTAVLEDFKTNEENNMEIKVSCFLHQKVDGDGMDIPSQVIEETVIKAFEL